MGTDVTFEEFPVFFPAGPNMLSGVVCVPAEPAGDLGVVLAPSSAATRVHRNRMWVEAARDLAARGVPSIRMDYRGGGESTGTALVFDLEHPFVEDVAAAAAYLQRATGAERLLLAGTCYGARCAAAAVGSIEAAAGLVLMPTALNAPVDRRKPPVRTRLKRRLRRSQMMTRLLRQDAVLRARKAIVDRGEPEVESISVSPAFERDLVAFLQRGDVWFFSGDADKRYPQLQRCLRDVEPRLSEEARGRLHVDVAPGRWIEKFHTLGDQQRTIDAVVRAVEALTTAERPSEESA